MNGQDNQNPKPQSTPQPQPAVPMQPTAPETAYVRPGPTAMPGDLETVRRGLHE